MAELYQLQEQEIPLAMKQLQESHANLKKVADYCEGLYLQADDGDKRPALEETRGYTTQALASVAYQINTLATSFLSLLHLQANQLAGMESSVNHLAQTVAIHKEKVARREIGVLTTNKSFFRPPGIKPPGIIFPEQPEKVQKYTRKPIDYTILDNVGHGGVRTALIAQKPSVRLNSSNQAPSSHPPTPPPSVIGTINRSHYHTGKMGKAPGLVAPPVAPPTVPSHYMSAQQLQQAQQAGATMNISNILYGQGQMNQGAAVNNLPNNSAQPVSQYARGQYNGVTPSSPPPPPPLNSYAPEVTIGQEMLPPPPADDEELAEPSFDSYSISGDRHSIGPPPPPPLMSEDIENASSMGRFNVRGQVDPSWAPQSYLEKVLAIFDYEPQHDDELQFKENAVIYVINKNADGWWEGVMEQNGQPVRGLFPENYVESLL